MHRTTAYLKRAAGSGGYASALSTVALLLAGARDCRDVFAPVNAVSHWIWRDKAIHQNDASWKYTAVGYGIHHLASIFWALFYEAVAARIEPKQEPLRLATRAATVASVACLVDMRCTPERLTPGFERRLNKPSIASVYVGFALGLALHTVLRSKRP